MQLQNGRPTDTTGRLDKEIRTYDFLYKLGIEFLPAHDTGRQDL